MSTPSERRQNELKGGSGFFVMTLPTPGEFLIKGVNRYGNGFSQHKSAKAIVNLTQDFKPTREEPDGWVYGTLIIDNFEWSIALSPGSARALGVTVRELVNA